MIETDIFLSTALRTVICVTNLMQSVLYERARILFRKRVG